MWIASIVCSLLLSSCELATLCQAPTFTFVVNTTEEGDSPAGYCGTDGPCTLRSAINTANLCRGGGPTTVLLQEGQTYTLTVPDSPTGADGPLIRALISRVGPTALPRILGTLTIEGQGATIARSSDASQFRLIHVYEEGNLTLRDVTLMGGSASIRQQADTPLFKGGAIYNEGVVALENTTLTQNIATGRGTARTAGGAIFNVGTLEMTGGSLTSNAAALGAAIFNTGIVKIRQTELSENRTGLSTVYNEANGLMEITESLFTKNYATDGSIHSKGILRIDQSTFHENGGMNSGSVYLLGSIGSSSEATIRRSTFVSNTAPRAPLVCDNSSSLHLEDLTVYQNEGAYFGGVIQLSESCVLVVSNTVFANNIPLNCGFNSSLSAVRSIVGENLSSDASCADFSITNAEPHLGTLRNNGGETPTLLPEVASPLVDAGGDTCLEVDQRGLLRGDGSCDIGAVERQPDDLK